MRIDNPQEVKYDKKNNHCFANAVADYDGICRRDEKGANRSDPG
jgi:hypothetical protein